MNPENEANKILSYARRDPIFGQILENLSEASPRHINITGLTASQKAYYVMALAKETGKRPVILVQDELRARVLMEDLSGFADGDVLVL